MKSIFIIGPSGSGKSSLCESLYEIYTQLFQNNQIICVNLDPANSSKQNKQSIYSVDINDLITLEDVMEEYSIGPNGALQYVMDFLYENKEWLHQAIKGQVIKRKPEFKAYYATTDSNNNDKNGKNTNKIIEITQTFYIFFDLPGQIQLYLNHDATKKVIKQIGQMHSSNSVLLEMFDSTYLYNFNDYISLCMASLSTMINFQMPHIGLLSKIDVLQGQRPALGMLNDYFEVYSAKELVSDLSVEEQQGKTTTMSSIANIIDQFGQVSFLPISLHKIELIKYLITQISKTFNEHQNYKSNNKKYANFTQSIDFSMAKQQIITSLENQLFEEEKQENQVIDQVLKQQGKMY